MYMSKDGKTKDIFFGIVAVATLIVAIIGATLAYFSITASSNEGAINATAATVSIEYNDGQQVTAQADKLIPADFETVVKPVYEANVRDAGYSDNLADTGNICIDSNSKQVCSAYRFTVTSDLQRTITATLNNESNGFTYLHYALYDVTNQKWFSLTDEEEDYYSSINKCNNASEVEEEKCFTDVEGKKTYLETSKNSIFGKTLSDAGLPVDKGVQIAAETQVYDLVLFIRETNENQNIDQGKQYSGTIIIDVSTTDKNGSITGCVGDDC